MIIDNFNKSNGILKVVLSGEITMEEWSLPSAG